MKLCRPFIPLLMLLNLFLLQRAVAQDHQRADVGIASYYHGWLDGKTTANGEKYDETLMTAAHPSLPFNSKVKVTNLNNQKSIIVRINDRGPFIHKRIIDLSRAAADSLDFIFNGLAKVHLTILSYGKPNDALHQQLIADLKTVKKPHVLAFKKSVVLKDTAMAEKPILSYEVTTLAKTLPPEKSVAEAVIPETLNAEVAIPVTVIPEKMVVKAVIPKTVIAEANIIDSKLTADQTVYGLQIGSFKVRDNAAKLSAKMKQVFKGEITIQEIKKGNTSFFRLIIGKFADEKKAVQMKETLNKDYPESFIIRY